MNIEQVLLDMADKLVRLADRVDKLEALNVAMANKVVGALDALGQCTARLEALEKKPKRGRKPSVKPAPEEPWVSAESLPVVEPSPPVEAASSPEITATDIFCVEEQLTFGVTEPTEIADAIGEPVEKVNAVLALTEEERQQIVANL